mmetsp:Transcript_23868/g.56360  ORF Transcript_23868/g.56360 Transcript_23868/m.56360 type:complete len:85 (-) Transcript_23868:472-726(-)
MRLEKQQVYDHKALHIHSSTIARRIHLSSKSSYCSFASANKSLSSPSLCICVMMSHPPTNSPLTYSCGIVGHSLYFLTPSRMSG